MEVGGIVRRIDHGCIIQGDGFQDGGVGRFGDNDFCICSNDIGSSFSDSTTGIIVSTSDTSWQLGRRQHLPGKYILKLIMLEISLQVDSQKSVFGSKAIVRNIVRGKGMA